MKYRLTPLNIISIVLLGVAVYGAIFPGPMGFGLTALIFIPIGLFGLWINFVGQFIIKKYFKLILLEGILFSILTLGYLWMERTKTFIIPDQRTFNYVVTIYDVEKAEKLPFNFFNWKYKKIIPDDGVILTSTESKNDFRRTEIFTQSGLSLQNHNDTVPLCFGRVSSAQIVVDTKAYNYQAWKIDNYGIGYSANEIKELEESLKLHLKEKLSKKQF